MHFYKLVHLFKSVLSFYSFYKDRKKIALKAFISIDIFSKADPSIFVKGGDVVPIHDEGSYNDMFKFKSIERKKWFQLPQPPPLHSPLTFGASESLSRITK